MTESSKPKPLSVAVVGGGIGGLTLALGLLKYDHIDVQIYEAAPTFGEIGAGVGIGPNAQRALKMIAPHAWDAFRKHATRNLWESHADHFTQYVVGKGEREGQVIYDSKFPGGMQSLHRARFLDELVKGVPPERAHFNKRLQSLEEKDDSSTVLHFKDGTTATVDAVIGADGIHSVTREFILGERDLASRSTFAGSVAYRVLVPMDKAVEKLGAEYAQNSMLLCGPGKAIMSYPIDHGKILNVAVMDYEYPNWEGEESIMPSSYSQLSGLFESWGQKCHDVIELFDRTNLVVWAMRDDLPASTYTVGHVAMMGDAAHATTPYLGQGAAQAIEDALVLETLLGRVRDAKHVPNAFAAYDQVRRARSQRVVTTSREAGLLNGMMVKGIGDDLEKMREKLETRSNWVWNRDLGKQNAEAIALFEESL